MIINLFYVFLYKIYIYFTNLRSHKSQPILFQYTLNFYQIMIICCGFKNNNLLILKLLF